MKRFHINKHNEPAPCYAKEGNCPLSESPHFENKQDAEDYIDRKSKSEYGILPEVKSISPEWESRFLEYTNFNEFVKDNAKDIMNDNLFEGDPAKESFKMWKQLHYDNSISEHKELSQEEAIDIIRTKVRSGDLHGWFREYDSNYKPRIENAIITDPEVRNASMNIAYNSYKEKTGDNIDFDSFLNKEVEVYRGGNFNMIDNDVFVSYSFDKNVAEKFSTQKQGSEVRSMKVKIKDTLGSLQTTGEAELMVRRSETDL